ncbi:MAG: hypothetical protein JXA30_03685 [Deltaproteobacteria bacterium]|nr:hypothetical protein [Deltaproteobacteria bacterium]
MKKISDNVFLRVFTVAFVSVACSSLEPIVTCESRGEIRVICGLQNPEDLAVVPGGRYIVVSQLGSIHDGGGRPGNIALLDLSTEKVSSLFPQAGIGTEPLIYQGPDWGDENCPGPPTKAFNPHGIDLSTRTDGKQQLLAINHGGRESVEFFELIENQKGIELIWRGCAIAPDNSFLNDVVALPNGGFLVSHMFPKSHGLTALYHNIRAILGSDTGHVFEWRRNRGFKQLAGTDAPFPNGIEVSENGDDIYLNVYHGNQVRRVSRASGKPLGEITVPHPDNITWSDEGRLLVASHIARAIEVAKCFAIEKGACPVGFEVVEIAPDLSKKKRLFQNQGPPMGAGTVAVSLGNELFIGSFKADRMLRVKR